MARISVPHLVPKSGLAHRLGVGAKYFISEIEVKTIAKYVRGVQCRTIKWMRGSEEKSEGGSCQKENPVSLLYTLLNGIALTFKQLD